MSQREGEGERGGGEIDGKNERATQRATLMGVAKPRHLTLAWLLTV